MADCVKNPLNKSQREKAGAMTIGKYRYQYHWALHKAIVAFESGKEFAIIVELHEDVIYADSLDGTKAHFEFNQIKDIGKSFTETTLTKSKKNKEGEITGNSILGKLVLSYKNLNELNHRISELNLVATGGFSLSIIEKNKKYECYQLSDLEENCLVNLTKKIQQELCSNEELPSCLQFVVPKLKNDNTDSMLIGVIAKVIEKLYPKAKHQAYQIYTVLYDDLEKKGSVTTDFKRWDEMLENKALTSKKVKNVIEALSTNESETKIKKYFEEAIKEMGYSIIIRPKMVQCFERYCMNRFAERETTNISKQKEIKKLIDLSSNENFNNAKELFDWMEKKAPRDLKQLFPDSESMKVALMYEWFKSNI